jgi:hypothetical protein
MGKAEISEHLRDLITSIMKKATMELIRREARKKIERTKTTNVTHRKRSIQQEIEYADLCKTIQN